MLFIYQSNHIDILFSKICTIIQKKPLSHVFEKEIIINDNQILFQYLNIFIANKIGISANIKCISIKMFLLSFFKQYIPHVKKIFTYKKHVLIWKIIKIIEKTDFLQFINKNDKIIKKIQFAELMANLFKKYILHQPNWIKEWEKKEKKISYIDECDKWQIQLWKEVIKNNNKYNQLNYNFSYFFYQFNKLINQKNILFPKRIFLILSAPLNQLYIKIFKKISLYTDIYYLYVTSFIQKNNIFQKKEKEVNDSTKNISIKLLNQTWKKYEKYLFLDITNNKKTIIKNLFKKNNNHNLLNNIKNDILYLKNSKKNKYKKNFLLKDNSININICYNKQNEIEILYKKILNILNNNKNIHVGDIVVLSFSLENYITSINNVFQSNKKKSVIPFNIVQKTNEINQILSFFTKILNLSHNRFSNQEILNLLDIPYILNKFDISVEEVEIIYIWVNKTNIRWGINISHIKNKFFIQNEQNTWLHGLNKLLLNYAIDKKKSIWNKILTTCSINHSQSKLIGKLCYLINTLNKWRKKLSTPKYIKSWSTLFKNFKNDFFCKNEKIDNFLKIVNKNWINMINDIVSINYIKKISIDILHKQFIHFMKHCNKNIFLPGVVNFCHPSITCYIPFKVKYIIGMNHTLIPKKKSLDNFNLLNKYSSVEDISISNQICYFFLHNFISSQEYFYISYIGYCTKKNHKIYPSTLINQIRDHITLNYSFENNKNCNIRDNLEKISKHFYQKYTQEDRYIIKNIHKKNFNQEKNKITKINIKQYNIFFPENNILKKSIINIQIKELIYFWRNPIHYFFQKKLNIYFDTLKKNYTTEPFCIDQLDNYKINNILLENINNSKDTKEVFNYIKLSGILPHSFFGSITLESIQRKIDYIKNILKKYKKLNEIKNFCYKIKEYTIQGSLNNIYDIGLIRLKIDTISYFDQISLWIEHLIYCSLGGIGESYLISNQSTFSFKSLPHYLANKYLLKYIEGYIQGKKHILLLTKSGISWLNIVYDVNNNSITTNNNDKKKAYQKLWNTWKGNQYIKGEKENYYIQKITSKIDIKKLCKIAQKWFIPILKYKKIKKKSL